MKTSRAPSPPSTGERLSIAAARAAFHPTRFGFQADRAGWTTLAAGRRLTIAPLAWQHALAADSSALDSPTLGSPLNFVVDLQRQVWGMPAADLVPANLLAVLPDTGGSLLVAYDPDLGFGPAGWLGFAIALGARSGVLVSHMLGVRPDRRGVADIGWSLKVVQGYEALRTGHTCAVWTFDPMRGANARLNLEKLGATVEHFTIDKYGLLRTTLYGDVPSDRFTAHWDLRSPAVANRLAAIHAGTYRGEEPIQIDQIPEVAAAPGNGSSSGQPPRLRYRIPGDIDGLAQHDPTAAVRWRRDLRQRLGPLLTTSQAAAPASSAPDPLSYQQATQPGRYRIDGFATRSTAGGDRANDYLLRRRRDDELGKEPA